LNLNVLCATKISLGRCVELIAPNSLWGKLLGKLGKINSTVGGQCTTSVLHILCDQIGKGFPLYKDVYAAKSENELKPNKPTNQQAVNSYASGFTDTVGCLPQ